jgi:predicted adenine nucleotide alpha hydrolase (AANH) superfamily ATPase
MEKRQKAITDYALKENFEVVFGEYDTDNFFKIIGDNIEAPSRCHSCWQMRLSKTARYAKENGFDAFTTTLLVSPYQDIDTIKSIGEGLSRELGVNFIDEDFRGGFRSAQQFAREHNIYRQKYCGCVYSEKERFK